MNNKGITLVALIITIIVLLILAVVTISAISGDHIIDHAENAENRYSNAAAKEQTQINEYENYLDNHVTVSTVKEIIHFKIDGADCTAEQGMTWGQWISTSYNTIGAELGDSRYGRSILNSVGDPNFPLCKSGNIAVSPDDTIEADTDYLFTDPD